MFSYKRHLLKWMWFRLCGSFMQNSWVSYSQYIYVYVLLIIVNIVNVLSTCFGIGWGRVEMRLVRIVKFFCLCVFKKHYRLHSLVHICTKHWIVVSLRNVQSFYIHFWVPSRNTKCILQNALIPIGNINFLVQFWL